MPRRGREGEREGGREREIIDIKKAPLLRRAALIIHKMNPQFMVLIVLRASWRPQ